VSVRIIEDIHFGAIDTVLLKPYESVSTTALVVAVLQKVGIAVERDSVSRL